MPPAFHVLVAGKIGEADLRRDISAGERPRHFMLEIADRLGAAIHEPDPAATAAPGFFEKRLLSLSPALTAMVEKVAGTAGDGDVVFCNGEGPGLALAGALDRAGKKTKLALFAHNIVRPRMLAAMRLTGWFARLDRLYLNSPFMMERARRALGRHADKLAWWDEQVDDRFFSPGPKSADRAAPDARPLIVSVGLEQRDYRTLAAAIEGLDVEVRISAFSKDADAARAHFPDAMPANMSSKFYPWTDLAQLYRDADIVVSPLFENNFAAGTTALLEAVSVGKCVVSTQTAGNRGVFADPEAVIWTPPGDAAAMRAAFEDLIADPEKRDRLAARAHEAFLARNRKDLRAEAVAADLRALAEKP